MSKYEILQSFQSESNVTITLGSFGIDNVGLYWASQQTQIQDAVIADLSGLKIKLDSPETLIANKNLFDSLQDFEDAFSVYLRVDTDKEKLVDRCRELGVIERLKIMRSLAESRMSLDDLAMALDKLETSEWWRQTLNSRNGAPNGYLKNDDLS